jgi:hypothetical protein
VVITLSKFAGPARAYRKASATHVYYVLVEKYLLVLFWNSQSVEQLLMWQDGATVSPLKRPDGCTGFRPAGVTDD